MTGSRKRSTMGSLQDRGAVANYLQQRDGNDFGFMRINLVGQQHAVDWVRRTATAARQSHIEVMRINSTG